MDGFGTQLLRAGPRPHHADLRQQPSQYIRAANTPG